MDDKIPDFWISYQHLPGIASIFLIDKKKIDRNSGKNAPIFSRSWLGVPPLALTQTLRIILSFLFAHVAGKTCCALMILIERCINMKSKNVGYMVVKLGITWFSPFSASWTKRYHDRRASIYHLVKPLDIYHAHFLLCRFAQPEKSAPLHI